MCCVEINWKYTSLEVWPNVWGGGEDRLLFLLVEFVTCKALSMCWKLIWLVIVDDELKLSP